MHVISVIQNKPSVFEKRIRDTIEQKSKEFTDKVINSLRERHIDLKSTHAIFVGGGSILLEKYIRASDKIASPEIIKNINANSTGYEILLEKQKFVFLSRLILSCILAFTGIRILI